MANQPPPTARPFFRIGSVSRPAPIPAVQPQPSDPLIRPPFARPTFTVPFRPQTPESQPTQLQEPAPPTPTPAAASAPVLTSPIPTTFAPSSSKPTSLAPKPTSFSTIAPLVTSSSSVPSSPNKPNIISTSSASLPTSAPPKIAPPMATEAPAATTATRVATRTASPKIIKPSAPSQSPLTLLPPSQLKSAPEPEPKNPLKVFEQKNATKDVVTAKEKHTNEKKFSDSEWGGLRVITIAGENKGALMELGVSNKNSKDEGKWKMMEKNQRELGTALAVPMRAFINSNVQGVNNSILHNTSCTHHDPGVHVSPSTKPTTAARAIHLKDHAKGHHN